MNDHAHAPLGDLPQGPEPMPKDERDRALEASRAQRAFLANLRHELRTPINAIVGYSGMLLEDAADRGQADFIADLQKIHAAAQRFLACINDIVNFSTMKGDQPVLEQQSADTSVMIQEVVTTIRPLGEERVETARAEHGPILIVDDNVINRDVLSRRLERQGHRVAAAENGRQALDLLMHQKFDLVLLDIMMPEVNGFQVLQRLKADPTLRDIPVIMISALDEIDSVVRCIEMGAEDYLPKPFNPILLKARIGACLEKKRQRDQELEYLRHVTQVTAAAAAVEADTFVPETLAAVAARHDELGQLARVFQRVGREVQAREQYLRQMNQAASRFVPQEYLGFLQKESIFNISLGDHVSNEMTVMFSDLRDFTAISETMTPRENFDFVNAYLGRVSPVIREHHGFIVKYLGDGIMAIFPRCADNAVQAGIEKLNQVTLYNDYRRTKGRLPIQVGIGVNTGHMMVGMVGERHRMQGDAFSDDVNLTSRLEGLTKYYHVSCIISAGTYAQLADPSRYHIRFLDKVQVQGKQKALDLYEVYDADPPPVRALKQETQADFDAALRLYYAQEFADAQTKLFGVLQRNPKDKVAWQHLVQATQLVEQGVSAGWTGVTRMTEK